MNDPRRLTDDDRYALAARAEAGARANRPTHLVALAGALLVLALIVVLFAWRADAGAAGRLARAAGDLRAIEQRAARLAELESQLATSPDDDRHRPIPDMLSRLGATAREAGLESVPDVPRQINDPADNARRVNYVYTNVRSESLERLVRWVSLTTERIPGMHVRRLSVKPQPNAWAIDVTFARYERLDDAP